MRLPRITGRWGSFWSDEKEMDAVYIVRVHFSNTSKETTSDKIKRMLKNEMRQSEVNA